MLFNSLLKLLRTIFPALCLVAATGASAAVFSQQPAKPDIPFARGEELVYQVEFNRALLRGLNVGDMRFSAQPSARAHASADGSAMLLVGDATAKGFLLKLFGSQYHLRVESLVNAESFAALRTKKVEEDRRRVRVSEAVFDHKSQKVTWTVSTQNQPDPPSVITLDFTNPIQDILTVIYFVRTQKLQPGQSFDVPLTDNNRVYRCSVNVMERKKIKSILGRVDTVRVDPAIFGDERVVRSRGTLSLWITDDARRIPVKAQLKVPIGTFDITLKRISHGKTAPAR